MKCSLGISHFLEEISATAAKSLQLCPTLCDPIDISQPSSPIPGILQARTLEWVASSFSNAWKWKVKVKSLSHVWLSVTPWTAAHQAPPPMWFSRQEHWSGVPLSSLEKISSLSQYHVLSSYLHWSPRNVFLSSLALLWNSAFRWIYLLFSFAFRFSSLLRYL